MAPRRSRPASACGHAQLKARRFTHVKITDLTITSFRTHSSSRSTSSWAALATELKAYASTYPNVGSPDVYAQYALECKRQGYLAYKIHPHYFWDPATRQATPERPSNLAADIATCSIVREADATGAMDLFADSVQAVARVVRGALVLTVARGTQDPLQVAEVVVRVPGDDLVRIGVRVRHCGALVYFPQAVAHVIHVLEPATQRVPLFDEAARRGRPQRSHFRD